MYSVEKAGSMNFLKRFEYPIFFLVLAISALGLIILSSAVAESNTGSSMMKTQVIGVILGITVSLIISRIDYKDFKGVSWLFYLVSIGLLIAVYFVGTDIAGNRNWIKYKGISIQPSEFTKITMVLYISIFLERLKEGTGKWLHDAIRLILFFALPVGIIFLEKDMGAVFSYTFIFGVLLFMFGLHYKYIIGMVTSLFIASPFIWFFVLSKNNKERIYTFLDPTRDPSDSGLNVLRSIRAIGSGGLTGEGLYKGVLTQSGSVPVKESDFIFSVVGEELGFIGACIIIMILLAILLRALFIARNSRELYGSYLAAGMTAILAFNFIENVGMTIGVLPVTGVPLPFVSQGGTAVLMNYMAIGVIMSVSIRRKRLIFNSDAG